MNIENFVHLVTFAPLFKNEFYKVKTFISLRMATTGMISLLSATPVFHLFVLVSIIPYKFVGGGRIENENEIFLVESIAIVINLFMVIVVLLKANLLKTKFPPFTLQVILWIMCGLFSINTIGNLFAKTEVERWVFTPITFLLALFSLRLAGPTKKPA